MENHCKSSLCELNATSYLSPSRTAVKLGEHNLQTIIDCEGGQCADAPQIIYPKTIIIPKEYNDIKLKHDVAVIELSEPAVITSFVSPVCLPTSYSKHKSLINEIVEVAGWGWFDIDDQKSSPELQVVKLPVVEIEKCRKIKQLRQYEFSLGQICVGGIAGKGKQTTQINVCIILGYFSVMLDKERVAFWSDFLFIYLLYVKQFLIHQRTLFNVFTSPSRRN